MGWLLQGPYGVKAAQTGTRSAFMMSGLSRCGRDDVGGWLTLALTPTLAVMGGPLLFTLSWGYESSSHCCTCRFEFAIARRGSLVVVGDGETHALKIIDSPSHIAPLHSTVLARHIP